MSYRDRFRHWISPEDAAAIVATIENSTADSVKLARERWRISGEDAQWATAAVGRQDIHEALLAAAFSGDVVARPLNFLGAPKDLGDGSVEATLLTSSDQRRAAVVHKVGPGRRGLPRSGLVQHLAGATLLDTLPLFPHLLAENLPSKDELEDFFVVRYRAVGGIVGAIDVVVPNHDCTDILGYAEDELRDYATPAALSVPGPVVRLRDGVVPAADPSTDRTLEGNTPHEDHRNEDSAG